MNKTMMSEEDLKWQRRDDARTLARAEAIKADKERYQGAIKGAREIAKEEIDRVQGIARIAGMKTPKVPKTAEPVGSSTLNDVIPTKTQPFNKRGYHNPATIGRF